MLTHEITQAFLSDALDSTRQQLLTELNFYDRRIGHPDLDLCFEKLTNELSQLRPNQVEMKSLPFDAEMGPYVTSASLHLISQNQSFPLFDARCIGALKPITQHEKFDVVHVGTGTLSGDYHTSNLTKKLVLASGHYPYAAMFEALTLRRAEGLILGPAAENQSPLSTLPPPSFFSGHRPFVFSLSRHEYQLVVDKLASGDTPKFAVETVIRRAEKEFPMISAKLDANTSHSPIVLVVDICEQEGAGSIVAALESLRSIICAIDKGLITLNRSIEFLFVAGPNALRAYYQAQPQLPKALIQLSLPRYSIAQYTNIIPATPGPHSFITDFIVDTFSSILHQGHPIHRASFSARRFDNRYFQSLPIDNLCDATCIRAEIKPPNGGLSLKSALDASFFIASVGASIAKLASFDEEHISPLLAMVELASRQRVEHAATSMRTRFQDRMASAEKTTRSEGRHLLWELDLGLTYSLEKEKETLESVGRFIDNSVSPLIKLSEAKASLDRQKDELKRIISNEIRYRVAKREKIDCRRKPLSVIERQASKTFYERNMNTPIETSSLHYSIDEKDRKWLFDHALQLKEEPSIRHIVASLQPSGNVLDLWQKLDLMVCSCDLRLLNRQMNILEKIGLIKLRQEPS